MTVSTNRRHAEPTPEPHGWLRYYPRDGDRGQSITRRTWQYAEPPRASCRDALVRVAERATEARGRTEGIRADIAGETVAERAAQRVADRLVRTIVKHGAMTKGQLRSKGTTKGRSRDLFDDAYALATECGRLIESSGKVTTP
jgi:hypothetical protein